MRLHRFSEASIRLILELDNVVGQKVGKMSEKVINPSSAGVEDGAMPKGIDASHFQ